MTQRETLKTVLQEVREKMTSMGSSEFDAQSDMPMLQDLWSKVQDLKMEMNAAKRKASDEAAAPYLQAIEEIERKYAFIMKLSM